MVRDSDPRDNQLGLTQDGASPSLAGRNLDLVLINGDDAQRLHHIITELHAFGSLVRPITTLRGKYGQIPVSAGPFAASKYSKAPAP